ncbi:hypothetical protein MY4824_002095 [Beauveria thailandica]
MRSWLTRITEPYTEQLFGECDQIPFHETLGLTGWYTILSTHSLSNGAEENLREIIRYGMDGEMFSQFGFKSDRLLHSRLADQPGVKAVVASRADVKRPILREMKASYDEFVTERLVDGIWTACFYQRMSAPMISYHRSNANTPRPIERLATLVFDVFSHRRRLEEDGTLDAATYVDTLEGQSASGAYSKWHAFMCVTSYQSVMSYLWDLTHHLPRPNASGEFSQP